MENEPAVIEKQMEETRTAMNEKLEALESKVADTVQSTTSAVQSSTEAVSDSVSAVKDSVENSVEAVKETVSAVTDKVHETVQAVSETLNDTVKSIKETFNISLQTQRHPWLIFGGSVGLGLLGSLLIPKTRHHGWMSGSSAPAPTSPEPVNGHSGYTPPTFGPEAKRFTQMASSEPSDKAESLSSAATGWVGEQLTRLKGLAVGSLMGAVRDMAKKALPEALGTRVAEEVDSITKGLGAEPIAGPVLAETK